MSILNARRKVNFLIVFFIMYGLYFSSVFLVLIRHPHESEDPGAGLYGLAEWYLRIKEHTGLLRRYTPRDDGGGGLDHHV